MSQSSLHTAFIRTAPAIFVFLWSTGYVGARFGLPYIEPLTMTTIRFSAVVVLLAAIVRWRGATLPRDPRVLAHLAVSGMLIHSCFIGGIFSAIYVGTEISIAALIAGAQPLLTAIIAVVVLRESLRRAQWTGFLLGFIGLAMVVMKSLNTAALPSAGLIACGIGLAGITLGTLYQKRFVTGVDLMGGSLVQFIFALIPCALWAGVFETQAITWSWQLIFALVWLVGALSIGAISVLLYLIREGAAARVSSLFYLVPPITALQGYALFGDDLSTTQIVGILVTAIGVALINYEPAQTVRPGNG